MSERDKQIIAIVNSTHWSDYGDVMHLEEECESKEAKKYVHDFCVNAYHREEAKAGML